MFGRELEGRSVDVRAKNSPLVGDLEIGGEAENLVAAAVREDGAIPIHEAMQSAELGDEFRARPEGQVIGIAENHLGTD